MKKAILFIIVFLLSASFSYASFCNNYFNPILCEDFEDDDWSSKFSLMNESSSGLYAQRQSATAIFDSWSWEIPTAVGNTDTIYNTTDSTAHSIGNITIQFQTKTSCFDSTGAILQLWSSVEGFAIYPRAGATYWRFDNGSDWGNMIGVTCILNATTNHIVTFNPNGNGAGRSNISWTMVNDSGGNVLINTTTCSSNLDLTHTIKQIRFKTSGPAVTYANLNYFDNIVICSGIHLQGCPFAVLSVNYSQNVLETSLQEISLIVPLSNATNINAILVYNGTHYSTSKHNLSTYMVFNATLYIPKIISDANIYNHSFYFKYNYTYNTTNENKSTETYKQNVYKMILTNCTSTSASTNKTIHSILKSELNSTNITGNIKSSFNVWHTLPSLNRNYSFVSNTTDYQNICIYPEWATYYANAIYEYSATNYVQRYYNLINTTLTNTTNELLLYLLGSDLSTNILIAVTDLNDDPIKFANILVYRYYPSTNSYNLVESLITDHNGEALAHLNLYDTLYKFVIKQNNIIIWETPSPTGIYRITLAIQINTGNTYLERFELIKGVEFGLTSDNTTRKFTFTYTDSSDTIKQGCLKVTRLSALNDEILTDNCEQSTSSTISYTLASGNLTGQYIAEGYIITGEDNLRTLLDTAELNFNKDYQTFGDLGVFVTILLVAELAALYSFSPPIAVVGALIGLIGSVFMGFTFVSYSTLILLVVVSIMLIGKMRK